MDFYVILEEFVALFRSLFTSFLDLWEWFTTPMAVVLGDAVADLRDLGFIGDLFGAFIEFLFSSVFGDLSMLSLMLMVGLPIYVAWQLVSWVIDILP